MGDTPEFQQLEVTDKDKAFWNLRKIRSEPPSMGVPPDFMFNQESNNVRIICPHCGGDLSNKKE